MILSNREVLDRNRGYHILTADDVAAGKDTNWWELEITGTVRNVSPSMWKLTHLTALYLNDNFIMRIPPAIGLLVNLRRLDLSNNRLRSLPPEIGDLIELRELMLTNNQLRTLPFELGKLFQLVILGLKGNPLPTEMLTLQNEHGSRKLLEFMLDNINVSPSAPPARPWIQLSHLEKSKPTAVFTLMCYNVLCERYATRQMYGYCPQWALSWEYRKKGILDEVRHYGADIISLQEVETDQYYNFFHPELRREGYEGVFSPKSRAKTMTESERKHVDGCAIFFRSSKFRLVDERLVEFSQVAMRCANGCDVMMNRVMTKDNIALAVLLETKEAAWEVQPPQPDLIHQPLMVATAHIHWDPEFCDVKLIQTMMLVDQLRRIIHDSGLVLRAGQKLDPSSVSLLLCGDLNSLPNSGVFEFLQKGTIPVDHPDFRNLDYKKCLLKMLSHSDDEDSYNHSFKLASAVTQDIMPVTNYTYDFKGMIDYIFYDTKALRPLGVLGQISDEWMSENKVVGCPHPHIHSDHFSLLVEFCMTAPHLSHSASLPVLNQGNLNHGSYNVGINRSNRQPSIGSTRFGVGGMTSQHISQSLMMAGMSSNASSGGSSPGLANGHPFSGMSTYMHQNGR